MDNVLLDPAKLAEKGYILIHPCTKLIIANDKLTERIFYLTAKEMAQLQKGKRLSIVEATTKKDGDIKTYVEMHSNTPAPLVQFHRAVLTAMMSQFLAGNSLMTVDMIHRTLSGKSDASDNRFCASDNLASAITAAIDKLAFTALSVNMSDLFINLNYDKPKEYQIKDVILSCRYATGKVNIGGSTTCTVAQVKGNSILYDIADIKKQLLTCDVELLNVPKQRNSVETISLKHYVLQRVAEIKLHRRNMSPIITFADVFTKCGLADADRRVQSCARQYIFAFMEHLKDCEYIKSFEFVKDGGVYKSIKI